MSTAGEKFFEGLTNGEIAFMSKELGSRMEDWQNDVSGIDLNAVALRVAEKRRGNILKKDDLDNLTPTETMKRLEESLEAQGFVDDVEVDEDPKDN